MSNSVNVAKTALIVDDDQAVLTMLDALLTDAGFITTCFQQGLPAIEAIAQQSFDVLVLDIGLPDTSGLVICERAREQYNSVGVIIIITADNRTERLVTALTLGADDFVPKPFDVDELLTRIDVKLKRMKSTQAENGTLTRQ